MSQKRKKFLTTFFERAILHALKGGWSLSVLKETRFLPCRPPHRHMQWSAAQAPLYCVCYPYR